MSYILKATYMFDYVLCVLFSTGEKKLINMAPLIEKYKIYRPLQDIQIFKNFHYDDFTLTRCNWQIDVAPEYVHTHSILVPTMRRSSLLSKRRIIEKQKYVVK